MPAVIRECHASGHVGFAMTTPESFDAGNLGQDTRAPTRPPKSRAESFIAWPVRCAWGRALVQVILSFLLTAALNHAVGRYASLPPGARCCRASRAVPGTQSSSAGSTSTEGMPRRLNLVVGPMDYMTIQPKDDADPHRLDDGRLCASPKSRCPRHGRGASATACQYRSIEASKPPADAPTNHPKPNQPEKHCESERCWPA
jgi:hypothetical protein